MERYVSVRRDNGGRSCEDQHDGMCKGGSLSKFHEAGKVPREQISYVYSSFTAYMTIYDKESYCNQHG